MSNMGRLNGGRGRPQIVVGFFKAQEGFGIRSDMVQVKTKQWNK